MGALISLFVSSLFIGLLYGLFTAFIFAIIDILTENPIKISDNLSVPISLTLLYILLNFLNIPYNYPPFLYV